MLSPNQLKALPLAAEAAIQSEFETQLPAELTLAQWALESGYGNHAPANNCFGIKAYPGCYGTQVRLTWEGKYDNDGKKIMLNQIFATFPTIEACFHKHASLITEVERYAHVWGAYKVSRDIEALIRDVAPIYARDPEYINGIYSVMPRVKEALMTARANNV